MALFAISCSEPEIISPSLPVTSSSELPLCTSTDPPPPTTRCTTNTPCTIMAIGDSLTVGCKSTASCQASEVPGAYRLTLANNLRDANKWVKFTGLLLNGPISLSREREYAAQPGYRIDQLLTYGDQLVRSWKPDIIIAMGGTNDANQKVTASIMQSRWENWRFNLREGGKTFLS